MGPFDITSNAVTTSQLPPIMFWPDHSFLISLFALCNVCPATSLPITPEPGDGYFTTDDVSDRRLPDLFNKLSKTCHDGLRFKLIFYSERATTYYNGVAIHRAKYRNQVDI